MAARREAKLAAKRERLAAASSPKKEDLLTHLDKQEKEHGASLSLHAVKVQKTWRGHYSRRSVLDLTERGKQRMARANGGSMQSSSSAASFFTFLMKQDRAELNANATRLQKWWKRRMMSEAIIRTGEAKSYRE